MAGEGHDGAGARLLGDMCLLGRGDVHDDAAFEHLGELTVELDALGRGLCLRHCGSFLRVRAECCGGLSACLGEYPIRFLGK